MASKTIENVNVKFPKEEDEENNRFEVSPRADEDVGSNITNQTASNSNSKQQQQSEIKRQAVYKKIGQYSLIKEIGHGSFARVYKGRTEVNGVIEEFAIKMIAKQHLREENQALIDKEINILLKLNHPNIIRLKDFKKTTNNWYLIFEFCELGDLEKYIKEKFDGRFPLKLTVFFLQQLADAFQEIRRLKIVHRDLKLANILINNDLVVKLGDFGFAKHFEDNSLLQSYCGTPITMAPEILKREKYNEKCDIWSLGIILYQMIYGKAPFDPQRGASISDLIALIDRQSISFEGAEITPELKELISRMLIVDINARLSFEEFFKHPCVQAGYINRISQPVRNKFAEEKIAMRYKDEDKKQEQKEGGQKGQREELEDYPQSGDNFSQRKVAEQTVEAPSTEINKQTQEQPQKQQPYSTQIHQQQTSEEGALELKERQNCALEYIHQKLHGILQEELGIFISKVTEYREIADQLMKDKNTDFGDSCGWSAMVLILLQTVKTLECRIEIQLNQEVFSLPLPKQISEELKELSKLLNAQVNQIPIYNMDEAKNLDAYEILFSNLLYYADYCLLNEFLNSPQTQLKYYRRCMKLCELLQSLRFSVFSRLIITLSEPSIGVSRQDIQKILQIAPLPSDLGQQSSSKAPQRIISLIKTQVDIQKSPMNSNFIDTLNIQNKQEEIKIQYEIYQSRYEACNDLVKNAKAP